MALANFVAAADPNAREKAEAAERSLYGARVVDLLTEARLPFGLEVLERG